MPAEESPADLTSPALYINRELSWLSFNRHVLDEAKDPSHPLLERVKFLSIFAGNLDEFFMIRIAGLRHQLAKGVLEAPPDGMSPARQLDAIRKELLPVLEEQADCWKQDLLPKLASAGIHIHAYTDLTSEQQAGLRSYFIDDIFPVLTPTRVRPLSPVPVHLQPLPQPGHHRPGSCREGILRAGQGPDKPLSPARQDPRKRQ